MGCVRCVDRVCGTKGQRLAVRVDAKRLAQGFDAVRLAHNLSPRPYTYFPSFNSNFQGELQVAT
jgi:hypothetical protein